MTSQSQFFPTINELDFSSLTVETYDLFLSDYQTKSSALSDAIALLPNEFLCYANLFQSDIDLSNSFQTSEIIMEMDSFHPDKLIREKCNETSTLKSKFDIDQYMRKDVYAKYAHYYLNQYVEEKSLLASEQQRLVEQTMLGYKLSGMELNDVDFEKVKEIDKTISELGNQFSLNLNNSSDVFTFTLEELNGMEVVNDGEWLKEKLQPDCTYLVTLKYPDYVPLSEYCKVRSTRKLMSIAYVSRCKSTNTQLCQQTFALRNERAKLLSYNTHSDYKLQKQMAKSTQTVNDFLNSISEKSTELLQQDIASLMQLAKEDGVDKIEPYDIAYYSRIFTEQTCDLNKESLKQYFSLETVLDGMFLIYQTLFELKFVDITEHVKQTLWDQTVRVFETRSSLNSELLGYFYLDLFPREGKYGHAAVFPVIRKSVLHYPCAWMACNFPQNSNLTFDDVETLFHEFGHVVHGMVSSTTIACLAGTSCERDFVETPSQMFEEWCYQFDSLRIMAPEIPKGVVQKLNLQRNVLQGLFIKRQLSFGLFDMAVHGDKFDLPCDKLYNEIYHQLTGFELDESTSFPASFGHIMGGYDAGYYGYLWSLVFAKDCFYSEFKGKELDSTVGRRFKEQVLAYGSSRDSLVSLTEFLGRSPNDEAFIKQMFN